MLWIVRQLKQSIAISQMEEMSSLLKNLPWFTEYYLFNLIQQILLETLSLILLCNVQHDSSQWCSKSKGD